jgi:hypothetical protein
VYRPPNLKSPVDLMSVEHPAPPQRRGKKLDLAAVQMIICHVNDTLRRSPEEIVSAVGPSPCFRTAAQIAKGRDVGIPPYQDGRAGTVPPDKSKGVET